jgi:hypothetical protein
MKCVAFKALSRTARRCSPGCRRDTHDVGETRHEGRAVERLELVEAAAVDDAGDDLAGVVGLADLSRDDAAELVGS